MSERAVRFVEATRKSQQPRGDALPLPERLALYRIRIEAKRHGTVLTDHGRGGLSPSLVLGVMRRDAFACKIHGDRGEGEHGGIQVHHVGGLDAPTSKRLARLAKRNDRNNLVTLCAKAHDEIHNRDRAVDAKVEKIVPDLAKEDPTRIKVANRVATLK